MQADPPYLPTYAGFARTDFGDICLLFAVRRGGGGGTGKVGQRRGGEDVVVPVKLHKQDSQAQEMRGGGGKRERERETSIVLDTFAGQEQPTAD